MKPYRCQICGEVYLGEFAPDRCPFCGVPGNYLLSAPEYIDYGAVELGERSKEFCRQALEIEASNVTYYRCAAGKTANAVIESIFKRVGKQESEHLELIAKMAGLKEPAVREEPATSGKPAMPDEPSISEEECAGEDAENMANAHAREDRAVKLYTHFAQEAPEGRMKEVFRALADVEMEHYKLFNIYR